MGYEFETVEELPPGVRSNVSEYSDMIESIKKTVHAGKIKAGQWVVLKTSDNKDSIAATCSNLKAKYGPVTANGLLFQNRPNHADAKLRTIYVTFEPHKIVEGEAEKWEKERKAKAAEAKAKAAKAKAEKEAAEGQTSKEETAKADHARAEQAAANAKAKAGASK